MLSLSPLLGGDSRHQDVFDRANPNQDLIWKIIVPAKERLKALSFLSSVNINAFSLFDSDESLMEILAVEHIDLHKVDVEARWELSAAAEEQRQGAVRTRKNPK